MSKPKPNPAASQSYPSIVVSWLMLRFVLALVFLIGFERLARLDLSPGASHRAAVYLSHAPLAFVLFAPYTEALFLLSSVVVFLMARRRAWWMAGTAAGLAALTRQQGVFLLIPLAWELWEWSGRDWRKVLGNWRSAMSLALAPAGLLVWLVYRAVVLADIAF